MGKKITKKKNLVYHVNRLCFNCDFKQPIKNIPKGKTVEDYAKAEKIKCDKCGCDMLKTESI